MCELAGKDSLGSVEYSTLGLATANIHLRKQWEAKKTWDFIIGAWEAAFKDARC